MFVQARLIGETFVGILNHFGWRSYDGEVEIFYNIHPLENIPINLIFAPRILFYSII